jgi:hypothetical protein
MSCKALKPKQKRPIHVAPKETVQHADDPALRPKGNGHQATVPFPDGVSINSEETYPTIAEA